MAETTVKCDASSSFLHDTDDFIQSHLEQHLPSSEEVGEKGNPSKSTKEETTSSQSLTDKFNPISLELCSGNRGNFLSKIPEDVRDKTPPMVTKYMAEFYWDTSGLWPDLKVKTHAKVRDVGGIEDVELKDLDNGESHSPDLDGTPTSVEFEHEFDTSVLTAGIGSVELELSAEDAVGNEVDVEEEVKGAIDTVLDALGQVWDAIAAVLGEVAEAVKDAVSVVVDFFWSAVKEIIAPLIDPVRKAFKQWSKKMMEAAQDLLESIGVDGSNSSSSLAALLNSDNESSENNGGLTHFLNQLYSGTFFIALTALVTGVHAAGTYLGSASAGVASIVAGRAISFIGTSLLPVVAGTMASFGVMAIRTQLHNFVPEGDAFWSESQAMSLSKLIGTLMATGTKKLQQMTKLDVFGLIAAIAGYAIGWVSLATQEGTIGEVVVTGLGVGFAAVGLGVALKKDLQDMNPVDALKNIEEVVSMILLGMAVANFGRAVDAYMEG